MAQHRFFGWMVGVAVAALGAGVAFAQTGDKNDGDKAGSRGQGQAQGQSQQHGQSGGSAGQSQSPGLGAGIGGEKGDQGTAGTGSQNICECPCGTPGARPRGSFGSGLPGTQDRTPGGTPGSGTPGSGTPGSGSPGGGSTPGGSSGGTHGGSTGGGSR